LGRKGSREQGGRGSRKAPTAIDHLPYIGSWKNPYKNPYK
jgi:hypothetical protein